jgi:hypothetical protein
LIANWSQSVDVWEERGTMTCVVSMEGFGMVEIWVGRWIETEQDPAIALLISTT